ncbi:MAG TPA: hypothetical protein VE377_17710 [Candidatus Dormibacteraeota bacterium]|nr:hypothetical protein [Candidatus Dormibacteraeota bacterium]
MLGFAITAAFVSYQLLTDAQSPISRSSTLMVAFVVLCPPSLLSLAFREPEVGSNGFFVLWTVIALLNGTLYASFRAFVGRRLQRPD